MSLSALSSRMRVSCPVWSYSSDATPENSCLYMIPRPHDPGYYDGDDDDPTVDKDPLQLCLPRKEAYQHITAVPAEAGSAVVFTHRIIHWGSRGRGRPAAYDESRKGGQPPDPRVCISFGFADDAFEPAYVSRAANLPFPPMAHRAALVCAQSIAYHERFPLGARMLRLMHDALTNPAMDSVLESGYRKKVMYEYVQAAAAAAAAAGGGGAKKVKTTNAKAKGGEAVLVSGDNSLAGRGRRKGISRVGKAERGDYNEDDVDDEEENAEEEEEEEEETNGGEEEDGDSFDEADDAMERALEAMIDAKMDGSGDDFVDDFDDFEDGVLEDEDGVSLVEPGVGKRKQSGGGMRSSSVGNLKKHKKKKNR